MGHHILRREEVEKRLGLSRASIYAMMAEGKFPKPIRLNERAVGWVSAELDEWVEAKMAARDQPAEPNRLLP
ncbi:MAG: AlpA family phage regulatory protein [Mesorhizobium sp.]|uniref:helix-turn-helix transcriptional regulator n=1 Tax=Mesorhizobium sp. TaxID=1871066 RepID=UPI000FE5941C|nr:AlpA family transcriptional regulator [Mesorhizobium sp.]RWL14876.1 MAG: AlpA family phage regulatory protein [Mesorhizobium sp.]